MSHTNFLGIPVEGDITRPSHSRVAQRPIEELQEPLARLIQHELFEGLRWRQYTPYFNDGDACVFGVGGAYIKIAGNDEEDGDYEDGFVEPWHTYGDPHPVLGKYSGRRYDWQTKTYSEGSWVVEPKDKDFVELAGKVCDMIGSGAFDEALLEAFGDHAEVTVRKDKIEVEFYEHD